MSFLTEVSPEQEVIELCEKYSFDFEKMKQWYDGYSFENLDSVYNPNSVMNAISRGVVRNYWISSETCESLKSYISMNFDGLKDDIISMLGGKRIRVVVSTFQNDVTSFNNKDDVLTLLIHLGYLGYDAASERTFIPNQEVSDAYADAVREEDWKDVGDLIRQSEDLLEATLHGNEGAVADALERVHALNSSVLQYNNEAALSSAIMIAYYTARRIYKIVPEFPQGKGFADLVFLPRKGSDKPVMIVELKCDKDADTAIRQIHENRYEGDLKKYFG
ncbi:MAG: AAA family ATPase, partial [Lachnospiraceae bacterium]|nr:AAA family ATPase [Lachnospiraceae bacterium]